jgi:hypothetical protein
LNVVRSSAFARRFGDDVLLDDLPVLLLGVFAELVPLDVQAPTFLLLLAGGHAGERDEPLGHDRSYSLSNTSMSCPTFSRISSVSSGVNGVE